jgi:hypothetical protein
LELRVLKESKVLLEVPDQLGHREFKAFKGLPVPPDPKEFKVFKDLLGLLENKEFKESLVLQALRVLREPPERQEQPDLLLT